MSNKSQTVLDAMRFRFACKEFDSKRSVSDDDFRCILEAAHLSPSSFGFEPWKFLVIQNPSLRQELHNVAWGAQMQLATCSHFVVVLARKPQSMSPTSDYIQRTVMEETQHLPKDIQKMYTQKYGEFLQSDFAYGDNERAKFEWACRQSYIALGNMLTAAAILGVDACPHEGFFKEPIESLLAKHGLLDLNEFGVACLVSFGYRKDAPKREKTRRPLDQVVQWVS